MQDDLLFLHQELRLQLDAACAEPVRDHKRIERITLDMLALERSLAASGLDAPAGSVCNMAWVATGG